jgi:restriction endonuclease S subunit
MVRLGDVADIIQGLVFDKENKSIKETNLKVLTNTHIDLENNQLNLKEKPIYLKENLEVDNEKKLKKDDIFIASSSGSLKHLGKVAYIDKDTDFYAGGFCSIIRCNNKIIPKFLFELLKTSDFRDFINTLKGSNINNLKQDSLKSIKIPLPPLEIQKELVEKIEKLEEKINSLKEKNKQIQKEIKKILKETLE